MPTPDVLKHFNLMVDGKGHAGEVRSYTPPTLSLVTEEHRAGGMDVPIDIDMGMEKMVSSFELIGYNRNVLALWGVKEGEGVTFKVKAAVEDETGNITAVIHHMRGLITKLDAGSWEPGQLAPLKVEMSLTYYKLEFDGEIVHEIDPANLIRNIGGTDRMEAIREAVGV